MDAQHDRMYILSRFIIFLPLVILLLSFYWKSSSPKRSTQTIPNYPRITPVKEVGSGMMDLMKSGTNSAKVDLKGSYKCEYNANGKVVNGFIKNKKVYIEFTSKNLTEIALVNGDCGYRWQKGTFKGEKMCGVSQIMSIYESLSSMPFMGTDSLFTMIGSMNPSVTLTKEEISGIAKSCKKQEVVETTFTIPSNISFENKGSFTSSPQQ